MKQRAVILQIMLENLFLSQGIFQHNTHDMGESAGGSTGGLYRKVSEEDPVLRRSACAFHI